MIKILFFLILLHIVSGMYKLNVRRCNEYDDYSINYLRYQYDFKYYPQFCNYEDKQFEINNLEFMRYSLDEFWYACDYEYKKNHHFIKKMNYSGKDIYDYGSYHSI